MKIKSILKYLIGIAILAVLIYKIGMKGILNTILKINIIYIPVILIIVLILNFFGTWKLMLLFKPLNIKMPFLRTYHLYFLSWCLSLFIPGRIGELFLVYFLKKEKIGLGVSSAIIIIDKIIGVIVTFILALVGMLLLFSAIESLKIAAIFLIGLLAFIYIIFSNFGRNLIRRFILKKWESKFTGFSKTLFLLVKKNKLLVFYNFLLSLIKWITNAFVLYILFIAFEQRVSIFMIILVASALAIISLIPISINGLGVKESVGIFLFSLVNIPAVIATSVFLTLLIINYLLSALYITLFFDKEVKTANIRKVLD